MSQRKGYSKQKVWGKGKKTMFNECCLLSHFSIKTHFQQTVEKLNHVYTYDQLVCLILSAAPPLQAGEGSPAPEDALAMAWLDHSGHTEKGLLVLPQGTTPQTLVSTSRRPGPPGPPKARGHKSGSTSSPWQGQSSPIQGGQETAPVGLGVREHPTQIYCKHHSASAPSLDCADKLIMAERRFVEQQA